MDIEINKLRQQSKKELSKILRDVVMRVVELEELGNVANKLLKGFHQALEFLRRPPISTTSKLLESIIKANESKRLKSYLEAGCKNNHDVVQNTNKLRTCLLGLQEHLVKAKSIINIIEDHLEDANVALRTANKSPSTCQDIDDKLNQVEKTNDEDDITSSQLEESEMTDYAALIAMIYTMVKQDYTMQEKIVTALNLKSSSGELDSYCLMWSLRPFIDDPIMQQALRLVNCWSV